MNAEQIESAASILYEAEEQGQACGLLSLAYPTMTLADAYAVQSALVARKLRADPQTGQPRVIVDTVADNAANAGIVVGHKQHALEAHDLRWVGAIVKRNGVVEETGLGAGVLDDPVTGIVWLVQRLAQYGQGLSAGDIVLSGSFIRPLEAASGSVFEADFGHFGCVDLRFE